MQDVVEQKLEKFVTSKTVIVATIIFMVGFWGGKLSMMPVISEYKKQIKLHYEIEANLEKAIDILSGEKEKF